MTSPSSNKPDTNDSAVISRILKVLGPIVSRPSLDRPDFMGHCLAKLSQIFSADLGFLLYHESKLKSLGSHDFYAHDKNSASESYFETLQDEGLRRALFEFAQKEPYLTVERSEEVPESLAVLREHLRFQKQSSLTIIPLVYNKEVYGILGFVSYHAVPHQQTELAQSWQLLSTILGNSLGRESIRIRNIHNLSRYHFLV
ncbi:MAG: hypothetical protein KDD62_09630, partial [Bdellovibrionales bacterium]|nr:hypothetical protein [Bdellovibrionales bacterium]